MRCDVNLSVRRKGDTKFGIRTEVKNLNSFTSVAQAIEYEYERHVDILESGGAVEQETRHFNAEEGTTHSMRDKENADDYRYFPDPDILEIIVPDEVLQRLRDELPELPDAKFERYVRELGVPEDDAKMLTKYRPVSEYFEKAAEGVSQPKTVASFIITQMFSRIQTEAERENWNPDTTAEQLRELVLLLESGKISRNVAKRVFGDMLETGKGPMDFLSEEDLSGFDAAQIPALCKQAIEENPKSAEDYRNGKEKAIKALVGAVMRATKGRADALAVEAELKRLLQE